MLPSFAFSHIWLQCSHIGRCVALLLCCLASHSVSMFAHRLLRCFTTLLSCFAHAFFLGFLSHRLSMFARGLLCCVSASLSFFDLLPSLALLLPCFAFVQATHGCFLGSHVQTTHLCKPLQTCNHQHCYTMVSYNHVHHTLIL